MPIPGLLRLRKAKVTSRVDVVTLGTYYYPKVTLAHLTLAHFLIWACRSINVSRSFYGIADKKKLKIDLQGIGLLGAAGLLVTRKRRYNEYTDL